MTTRWISVAVSTSVDVEVDGGTEEQAIEAAMNAVTEAYPFCEETSLINVGTERPAGGFERTLSAFVPEDGEDGEE